MHVKMIIMSNLQGALKGDHSGLCFDAIEKKGKEGGGREGGRREETG